MFKAIVDSIRARLPSRQDTVLVFGAVLFAVFGWAIRGFFFKLPSFSLYFGIDSILAILSYMLAFALFESLLVTSALLLVAAGLPARWFRAGFVYKSFLVLLVATIAMILFEGWYKADFFKDILAGMTYPFPPFILGSIASILALALLLWLVTRLPVLQRILLDVIERLSLFTYIYVPLGLIGLLVVLIRNL